MGIKLFGKNVFQIYKHHIMELDFKDVRAPFERDGKGVSLRPLDLQNIRGELESVGTTVSVKNLELLVRKNAPRVEGFILCDEEDRSVGTVWVMYRGSKDLEYCVQNIDAYIFDVFVNGAHRGKGYAGEMISRLMTYLHGKGIDTAHLAVSTKNQSAIRAYEKAGFVTVCDRSFARVLKINIPYHKL